MRGRDDDIADLTKQQGWQKGARLSSVDHSPTATATTHNTQPSDYEIQWQEPPKRHSASHARQSGGAGRNHTHGNAIVQQRGQETSAVRFAPSRATQTSCRQEDDTSDARALTVYMYANGKICGARKKTQGACGGHAMRGRSGGHTRGEKRTHGVI